MNNSIEATFMRGLLLISKIFQICPLSCMFKCSSSLAILLLHNVTVHAHKLCRQRNVEYCAVLYRTHVQYSTVHTVKKCIQYRTVITRSRLYSTVLYVLTYIAVQYRWYSTVLYIHLQYCTSPNYNNLCTVSINELFRLIMRYPWCFSIISRKVSVNCDSSK